MGDLLAKLRIGSLVFHAIAAIALLVLITQAGLMAGICIFAGVLIACGSARAIPDRPITLYGAFGSLMGLSFWLAVGAIKTGQYLSLIPVLMLVIGAAWLLSEPEWPSAIFTWVSVGLCLGLTVWMNRIRNDLVDTDVEDNLRVVQTFGVILSVGLIYSILGFAEVMLGRKRRKKKKKSMAIRTPEGPPIL